MLKCLLGWPEWRHFWKIRIIRVGKVAKWIKYQFLKKAFCVKSKQKSPTASRGHITSHENWPRQNALKKEFCYINFLSRFHIWSRFSMFISKNFEIICFRPYLIATKFNFLQFFANKHWKPLYIWILLKKLI